MPKAYLIVQVDVRDPELYKTYTAQTPAALEKHGGRMLVRAGRWESLEGQAPRARVVVIEFPSFEGAKAWYDSEDYGPLIPLRQSASDGDLFIVEGSD